MSVYEEHHCRHPPKQTTPSSASQGSCITCTGMPCTASRLTLPKLLRDLALTATATCGTAGGMSQCAAEQVARRVLAADPGRPTDVLDLPHGASLDDVRKAYRKLARDLHPDKNPSPLAVEAFRRCG